MREAGLTRDKVWLFGWLMGVCGLVWWVKLASEGTFHPCLGDHGIAEGCAMTWPAQKYLPWCLGTFGALSQSRCDRLWWGSAAVWEELHPELLWGQQEAVGEAATRALG